MMITRRLALLGAVSAGALAACAPASQPAPEKSAASAAPASPSTTTIPAFSVQTADGRTVTQADFAGKAVVFEWTNHDCPFVKRHYNSANMQGLMEAAKAQAVTWVQVISSAPGKQGHVDAATALSLNAQRKAAMGTAFGAKTTPHMYVYAPAGALIYAGAIDDAPSGDEAGVSTARNYVREALAALQAGRAPDVTTAPAYGCSIKYAA
jgi:hypothetical protein